MFGGQAVHQVGRDAGKGKRGIRQRFVQGQGVVRWAEVALLPEELQHPVPLAQQGFASLAGMYG